MEHTNEFLRGMFAAYMGCDVMTKNKGAIPIVSILETGVSTHMKDSNFYWFYRFGKCSLILTPLSEIVKDSDTCDVVNKILAHHDLIENKIMDVDMYEFIHALMYGNSQEYSDLVCGYVLCEIIDYLRSKKYDCGYLHISSLIQAGLAVKATK